MSREQLLKNYSYMLLKELKRTSKKKVGDIEWYKDELKRVDQALKKNPAPSKPPRREQENCKHH